MLQKIRVLLLVCITAVLAACGGGGGTSDSVSESNNDSTPSFSGNYSINLNVSTNTCGGNPEAPKTGIVTQNGRSITMETSNKLFSGTVDSDNKGFAMETATLVVSKDVTAKFSANFRKTETVGVFVGAVREVGTDASIKNVCEVVYTGTITKSDSIGGAVAGVRG